MKNVRFSGRQGRRLDREGIERLAVFDAERIPLRIQCKYFGCSERQLSEAKVHWLG